MGVPPASEPLCLMPRNQKPYSLKDLRDSLEKGIVYKPNSTCYGIAFERNTILRPAYEHHGPRVEEPSDQDQWAETHCYTSRIQSGKDPGDALVKPETNPPLDNPSSTKGNYKVIGQDVEA